MGVKMSSPKAREKAAVQAEPIAIVGMAGLFPGSINLENYWHNILDKKDWIREVPRSHWLINDFYNPDPRAPEKVYACKAGVLPEIPFDYREFGIPPNVLKDTDSTQLLGLAMTKALLENAFGEAWKEMDRERVSVILGFSLSTILSIEAQGVQHKPMWIRSMREAGVSEEKIQEILEKRKSYYPEITENTFPGALQNVIAGRIANRFDFHGTNCITDAACASSLSAINLAMRELRSGDSDLAISGGIQTISNPMPFVLFSKTPALSFSGFCRPFDDDADGTMLGEGVGFLALMRLSDAEAQGKKIYALIRDVGSSSDGKGKSIYAPESKGQVRALRRAYQKSGIEPESVELVETHGTGTLVGDAVELNSLKEVFDQPGSQKKQWCAIGSIKSQVGHCLGAAGSAGLIKSVLALHHKILPPTINVKQPTRSSNFKESPFYINTQARPWIHSGEGPRRAGVSSFGFGGTNFHTILEEYRGPGLKHQRLDTYPSEVFTFSDEQSGGLVRQLKHLLEEFKEGRSIFALASGSHKNFDAQAPHRLTMVIDQGEDPGKKIQQAINALEKNISQMWLPPLGIYYQPEFKVNKVGFLFPGQGSQYLHMGAQWAMSLDAVRELWDQIDGIPLDSTKRLSQVVFPIPVFNENDLEEQRQELMSTQWAQPALAATSAALLAQLSRLGIQADALAGHSFGEITALYHAGCFDLETFILIARKRGELMAQASSIPGGMLAVSGNPLQIQKILQQQPTQVVIANINSPEQSVLSGPKDELEAFAKALKKEGLTSRPLKVATAFHSPLVASCAEEFRKYLDTQKISGPQSPVYSNLSAAPYPQNGEEVKDILAKQLANPVRFCEEIQAMHAQGVNLFLEVGPGAVLTGLVNKCLGDREHKVLTLDHAKKDSMHALQHALAQGSALGLPIQWQTLPERQLASFAEAPNTPTTVKISGATYAKKYPLLGDSPADEALSREPQTPIEKPAQQAKGIIPPSGPQTLPAIQEIPMEAKKAVGSDWMPPLETQAKSGSSSSPYSLSKMPAAPKFKAPNTGMDSGPGGHQSGTSPSLAEPETPKPAKGLFMDLAKFKEILLEVVSEKTGYPQDILTEEMDLEADLGIDSIKRVNIFMALKERVPELPEVGLEQLAPLHTLGQIMAFITQTSKSLKESPSEASKQHEPAPRVTAPPAKSKPTAPDAKQVNKIRRSVLQRVPLSSKSQVSLAPNQVVLIFGDDLGVGSNLVKLFENAQIPCRLFNQEEEIPQDLKPAGVIYLGGMNAPQHFYAGAKKSKEAFRLAHRFSASLQKAIEQGGAWWITVQDLGGNFGLETGDTLQATQGALAGLTKTIAQEWPGIYAKAIDIANSGKAPETLAQEIFAEIHAGGEAIEVALSQDGPRQTLQVLEEQASPTRPSPLNQDSVLVVSGGARGITAACVIALAKRYRPKIVLFGRSKILEQEPDALKNINDEAQLKGAIRSELESKGLEATPKILEGEFRKLINSREVRKTLTALQQAGSPVKYYAVDIMESRLMRTEGPTWTWKAGSLVRAALAEVREEWGPITGLIHGAGVIQDKLIQDKSEDQFDLVFDTKVSGLNELLNALEKDPLNVMLLFSSISARYGNRGQCDYAMANEVMNKIAQAEHRKRGRNCLVKSLNWGPWEGGLVNDALQFQLKRLGIPMIPVELGAEAFVAELESDSDQVEVLLEPVFENLSSKQKSSKNKPEGTLFDSIQKGKNKRGLAQLKAKLQLDPGREGWLMDHCPTFTIPTLPLAGMIRLMELGATELFPHLKVKSLKEVQASQWLSFAEGPQEIEILVEVIEEKSGTPTLSVQLRQFRNSATPQLSRWEPFCTGKVCLGNEFEPVSDTPRFIDKEGEVQFSAKGLYEKGFRFHGPYFQVLEELKLLPEYQVSAIIKILEPDPGHWLKMQILDGAAQSLPHEEATDWMDHNQGKIGLPLCLKSAQFFSDAPKSPRLRVEVDPVSTQLAQRMPEFRIRIFDGTQSDSPLWAKLHWVEILVPLGPLGRLNPLQRKHFAQGEAPLIDSLFSVTLDLKSRRLDENELKQCDWLPGSLAKIYCHESELAEYFSQALTNRLAWLAPRILAKETVALDISCHPRELTVKDQGDGQFQVAHSDNTDRIQSFTIQNEAGAWFLRYQDKNF